MKGLLIKDIKLMKTQKNFFLYILVIVIASMILEKEITAALAFLSFLMSLLVLTTFSYDDFDHGYSFLMTLPITRKQYVTEKYFLALLLCLGSWLLGVILAAFVSQLKEIMSIQDLLLASTMILPFIILLQAITIPLQLKFGAEKGRIVLIVTFGAIAIIGMLMTRMSKALFGIDLVQLFNALTTLDMTKLIILFFVTSLICLMISYKITHVIMKHKEL